jgi:hypothetical protein
MADVEKGKEEVDEPPGKEFTNYRESIGRG